MTRRTRLGFALDFSADDLAVNQQGKISAAQIVRLRKEMMWTVIGGGLLNVVLLGFLIGLITKGANFLLILLLLFLFVGMGGGALLVIRDKQADLRGGVVLSVTGVGETWVQRQLRGGDIFHLKIDSHDFRIHAGAYYAFYPGNHYQVFYTPNAKIILSAVRLDNMPPSEPPVPG